LINKEVLFLDDLGAEKASDWVKEQLYIVLNERYNWCRPTMFTTNLRMKEIAEHYGERFASRLVEMCEVIKIEAPDRRLEKGE
jgi:DNA replication protein DnaC